MILRVARRCWCRHDEHAPEISHADVQNTRCNSNSVQATAAAAAAAAAVSAAGALAHQSAIGQRIASEEVTVAVIHRQWHTLADDTPCADSSRTATVTSAHTSPGVRKPPQDSPPLLVIVVCLARARLGIPNEWAHTLCRSCRIEPLPRYKLCSIPASPFVEAYLIRNVLKADGLFRNLFRNLL